MAEGMNLDDLANEYVSKAAVLAQKGDCYDAEGHLLYAVGTGNIMRLPAADVVEVVRCKDCVHRDPEDHKCDCGGQERQGCPLPVRGSYFCAYGKRKDGGQDDA